MTERILGETGSKRRRRSRFLFLPVLLAAALALMLAGSALAVHDETFQLDGDVLASTTTFNGGTTQTVDWDSLINTDGTIKASVPTGFTNTQIGFDKDFNNTGTTFLTSDTTTFATGSKDTLPISGWQCNFDNNVNSKIDIMNSYAAAYTATSGDQILYFALERNTNTGDANVAFWFLQSDVNCATAGASQTFTGQHTDGDLLVVSAFTKGGDVSTIDVYRWNGGANGTLGTTPVASGVDCRSATTLPDDPACAAANESPITTPWLTANFKQGVGHSLQTGEFFEGGVNLTDSGLGGKCFNVFIGDTRSSQSLTATLFDYARGRLGQCVPGMLTQASTNGTVTPGTAVHDTATITVTGATSPDDPTGDVTFFLCGPIATGDCSTNGTNIGTGTLANQPGGTTTDGIAVATSPDVNTAASPLAAGRYCFRAEWPGDSNYAGTSHTDSTSECFSVKDTSATTTAQNWLPNDTASVTTGSGTAASGTVVFTLYDSANCTGGVLGTFTDTSAPYATNNTTTYTANKTISWRAVFTPTDPNAVTGSTSHCETSTVTINNDIGS